MAVIDAAVRVSAKEVDKFISSTQRTRPGMSKAELINALGWSFTGLVTVSGGAAGGIAAAPAIGTAGGVAAAVADVGAFTMAAGVYVLSVASVHGIAVDDLERRKALLLMVLAGPGGVGTIERLAGRAGGYWGRRLTGAIPMTTIRSINRVLGPNVVTKYGTKQGILVVGKLAPFGIGAVIGGAGNAVMAQMVIRAARSAFGPLPPDLSTSEVDGDSRVRASA